ncbi:hypothetical protein KY321_03315, partial [Candidatus Woesearchaeota archaeon]|nr:hypothetical protein [Candidatus Woesearchaeota archaeon]
LFGLSRGKLSGESLLRKGTDECFVELTFEIDENEYTIKRSLKKGKVGISQTPGFIIENGLKTDMTPVELRSKILTILNYPSSLKKSLTSAKHFLIFRYTVYTPQEEMKRIISDSENRLDVLRDIFNIDKYKLIKKNCELYIRGLDKEIYLQENESKKLDSKLKEKDFIIKEKNNSLEEIDKLKAEYNVVLGNKQIVEKDIKSLEISIELLRKTKQEFALKEQELQSLIRNITSNNETIESLSKDIFRLEEDLKGVETKDTKEIEHEIKILETEIINQENLDLENKKNVAIFNNKILEAEELNNKINSLDHCPLCLQNVTHEHKDEVINKEKSKIEELKHKIDDLLKNKIDLEPKKKRFNELKEILSKNNLIVFKQKNLIESRGRVNKILEKNNELKKNVGLINNKKLELNEKISNLADVEKRFSELNYKLNEVKNKESEFKVLIERHNTKIEHFEKDIEKMDNEIKYIQEISNKLNKNRGIRNWLKDHFLILLNTIENHVMLKIQQEFDLAFQEWFNFLLEDENIIGRLDEKFSPIIETDGYEIDFNDLSGGEKTSVALAYRLALNKVINDFMSDMNTKDFIILDEPTDGFSSEQLDKLKDVLDQINIKQIMIVSHETKIESFVNRVIRIDKHENISHIV